MSKLRDLNSAIRIFEHAEREGARFGGEQKRMQAYLATKTPDQLQELQNALHTLMQNPPERKPGESDSDYTKRYTERNERTDRYEKLVRYV